MTPTHSPFQADLAVDRQRYAIHERVYLVLAATFVTLLVLTNIIGIKLFQAPFNPNFALTTGILTYPFTFLVTDLVSEIYGKRRADFMVIIGFVMSLLMLLIVQLAMRVPAHEAWVAGPSAYYQFVGEQQYAFESVFALNGVLLFGSMTAYLCAQLTDNFLFHFWKRVTSGRHLWLRNNGSTMISQLVDTAVVNSILFYVGFRWGFVFGLKIMATIYVYKLIIALFDTPFIYLGVYVVKRILGYEWHEEVKGWHGEPS